MCSNKTLTTRLLQRSEWDSILKLRISPMQKNFLETSAKCLNDAENDAYKMKWDFYGIFIDESIIGFAMHGRQTFKLLPFSTVWLDRFMIDKRYQGNGYGKKALQLILKNMFKEYNCKKIYLSVYENNFVAIELYKKLGFKKTIFKDSNKERIMVLKNKIVSNAV